MAHDSSDLYLLGYGTADALRLTLEAQRILARVGKAYVLGAPPGLTAYLRKIRVEVDDLAERPAGNSWGDRYLAIADTVLGAVEADPPVALLCPGNPLLSNAIGRYLVTQARERGFRAVALPAVSPIDDAVCITGLDVGAYGLQVFDARRVVEKALPINPGVPVLLLQLASVATGGAEGPAAVTALDLTPLVRQLGRFYPPTHRVVHIRAEEARPRTRSHPLAQLVDAATEITTASTLFIDLVRPPVATQA